MSWINKKVLVTGSEGFIGKHLVKRLTVLGTELTCIDKKINIDVRDSRLIDDLMLKNFDYIFHFGAPSSVILYNRNPVESLHNTIIGFENVLELAKLTGVKLIYPSTGNVYAPGRQAEDEIPYPTNLYGMGKLLTEKIPKLSAYSNSIGLRIFAGYGPGEEPKKDIASIVEIFLNDILNDRQPIVWGDGTQARDFIFIDDIIDGIIAAAEREVPTIINLGTGKSTSFNEVIRLINQILGKNIKPIYVDKPSFYIEKTKADITLMKKWLKINPMSLEEGLKKYIKER